MTCRDVSHSRQDPVDVCFFLRKCRATGSHPHRHGAKNCPLGSMATLKVRSYGVQIQGLRNKSGPNRDVHQHTIRYLSIEYGVRRICSFATSYSFVGSKRKESTKSRSVGFGLASYPLGPVHLTSWLPSPIQVVNAKINAEYGVQLTGFSVHYLVWQYWPYRLEQVSSACFLHLVSWCPQNTIRGFN